MIPAPPSDTKPIADLDDPREVIPGYAVRADGVILRYASVRLGWVPCGVKVGPGGFRRVLIRGREIGVAHLVLRAFVGARPLGYEPLHYPDPDPGNNRLDNLRWAPRGTSKVGRMTSGRPPVAPSGESHPHAVLNEPCVIEVRRLYRAGVNHTEIAEHFGVDPETIRNVLLGRTWGHVVDPDGPIVMRRRGATPEEAPLARLDFERAGEIRALLASGKPPREVAEAYGVSTSTIRDIQKGRTWREGDHAG